MAETDLRIRIFTPAENRVTEFWEMDTIFTLAALGVCWGLQLPPPPQEQPIDQGVGPERPPR